MRAIVQSKYGPPGDVLELQEIAKPVVKDDEVLVRVRAASVNDWDWGLLQGPTLPFIPRPPKPILGSDIAGEVVALGSGVQRWRVGEEVHGDLSRFGGGGWGGFAEYVCTRGKNLALKPGNISFEAAAAAPVVGYTAVQGLRDTGKIQAGQKVLVNGAAGGVGSALLQLGRLVGLEMYGTCSSQGASTVSDLGGVPIDYRHVDFVKEIHRLTGDGVDIVFDGIGGTHIWRSRKALRRGGKVVAYGLTSSLRAGRLASAPAGRRRRFRAIAIFGVYIAAGWLLPGRKRVVPYSIQWLKRLRPAWFRQDLIALFDLLHQKKIKPLIAQRFPLAQARHAHELLGKGGVTGKIVLVRNVSSLESGAA